jgi:hypothetical protein
MPAFWSQVDVSQSAARAAGTAPCTGREPTGRVFDELLDDRRGLAPLACERPVQALAQLGKRRGGAHRALRQSIQVLERQRQGAVEQW